MPALRPGEASTAGAKAHVDASANVKEGATALNFVDGSACVCISRDRASPKLERQGVRVAINGHRETRAANHDRRRARRRRRRSGRHRRRRARRFWWPRRLQGRRPRRLRGRRSGRSGRRWMGRSWGRRRGRQRTRRHVERRAVRGPHEAHARDLVRRELHAQHTGRQFLTIRRSGFDPQEARHARDFQHSGHAC